MEDRVSLGAARVLLIIAGLSLAAALVSGLGWWLASRDGGVSVGDLTTDERRLLVEDLLNTSPGVFRPALYDPRVGYTLRPLQEIDQWNDSFRSNGLGYRSGQVRKRPGDFRIVFVGDSWTFGMGVSELEAFPRQLEQLAQLHSGSDLRVEAWSLALPGYNILNETAALDGLVDTLDPDAVVFCPTNNDVDSGHLVLPNGSLSRAPMLVDGFGMNVPLRFQSLFLNSHLFLQRWRHGMNALGALGRRLGERETPALVFFTGRWVESFAHDLIGTAEIDLPYVITPDELSSMKWRNPPPFHHPNPAAHREYARLVYRGLAQVVEWRPLPDDDSPFDSPVHRRLEQRQDWRGKSEEDLRSLVAQSIEPDFVPKQERALQVGAGVDLLTGRMGRGAVVFLRRLAESREVVVSLGRLPDVEWIYPLGFRVSIPSGSGSTAKRFVLPAGGPDTHRFSIDLPDDIPEGVAVEIIIEAESLSLTENGLAAASMEIVKIEQE